MLLAVCVRLSSLLIVHVLTHICALHAFTYHCYVCPLFTARAFSDTYRCCSGWHRGGCGVGQDMRLLVLLSAAAADAGLSSLVAECPRAEDTSGQVVLCVCVKYLCVHVDHAAGLVCVFVRVCFIV